MKVSWDDEIPNIWKHKKTCSQPPIRFWKNSPGDVLSYKSWAMDDHDSNKHGDDDVLEIKT